MSIQIPNKRNFYIDEVGDLTLFDKRGKNNCWSRRYFGIFYGRHCSPAGSNDGT